ncbi:MAG: hypothetical protein H0T52_00340, partial [Lautropia sp.]|nr:hypothetical protein [Lautropia sp.]
MNAPPHAAIVTPSTLATSSAPLAPSARPSAPDAAGGSQPATHALTSLELTSLELTDSFGKLGEAFFSRVQPTPLADPYFVAASQPACALVGVDPASLQAPEAVSALAGNTLLPRSSPLAAVYAG